MITQIIEFQCDECGEKRGTTEVLTSTQLNVYTPTLPNGWSELIEPSGIRQICEWHTVHVTKKARTAIKPKAPEEWR